MMKLRFARVSIAIALGLPLSIQKILTNHGGLTRPILGRQREIILREVE
jgi:hypothetical protein